MLGQRRQISEIRHLCICSRKENLFAGIPTTGTNLCELSPSSSHGICSALETLRAEQRLRSAVPLPRDGGLQVPSVLLGREPRQSPGWRLRFGFPEFQCPSLDSQKSAFSFPRQLPYCLFQE